MTTKIAARGSFDGASPMDYVAARLREYDPVRVGRLVASMHDCIWHLHAFEAAATSCALMYSMLRLLEEHAWETPPRMMQAATSLSATFAGAMDEDEAGWYSHSYGTELPAEVDLSRVQDCARDAIQTSTIYSTSELEWLVASGVHLTLSTGISVQLHHDATEELVESLAAHDALLDPLVRFWRKYT